MARILVIEDDQITRELIELYLRREGHEVESMEDGLAALDRALAAPPELVISDLNLPGLGGFAILSALRADARTAGVKVVLMSASFEPGQAVPPGAQAADAIMSKHIRSADLMATVRRALGASPGT